MRNFFLIILLCCAVFTRAQDSLPKQPVSPNAYVQMCEVKMNNGQVYKGEVKQENDSILVLLLPNHSEMKIAKSQAAHFSYYMAKNKSKFVEEVNPEHIGGCFYGATRNAFLFVPKRVEINSTELFLYNYNYNLSKNYSVGLTTSLFLMPALAHGKAHYQVASKTYLGFEAFAGISGPVHTFFIGGGAIKFTLGDYNKHLTATVVIGNGDSQQAYAFGLGGAKRLPGDVYLVSELWAAKDLNGANFSIGLRTVAKPRVSWLWGIGALLGDIAKTSLTKYVTPYPYFGFSFRT